MKSTRMKAQAESFKRRELIRGTMREHQEEINAREKLSRATRKRARREREREKERGKRIRHDAGVEPKGTRGEPVV
jgi:hypothetical protein